VIPTEFTNPFTQEKIIRDRVFIPSRITDNKYLGDDCIANLHSVGNDQLVRAWLLGDWDIIIGAFFDNWDRNKHVIEPCPISSRWLKFMAGDWGSARPFAFGWFAVAGEDVPHKRADGTPTIIPRGALIMYREYYGMQKDKPNVGLKMTVEDVADAIHKLEANEPRDLNGKTGIKYRVLDPRCFANEGGATHAERFGNKRLYFNPANNIRTKRGETMGGWDMIRHRLDGEDGRPMLYFFDNCRDTIRTLPAQQHDPANLEDIDTEGEDHAVDMVRYACASRPRIKRDYQKAEKDDPEMQTVREFPPLFSARASLERGRGPRGPSSAKYVASQVCSGCSDRDPRRRGVYRHRLGSDHAREFANGRRPFFASSTRSEQPLRRLFQLILHRGPGAT
jgi:hypothetical protein